MKAFGMGVALLCLTAGAASPGLAQMMTLGVSGGANLSNVSAKVDGASVGTDSRTGFNLGGILGMQVSSVLDVQVAGQFSMKGFDLQESAEGQLKPPARWCLLHCRPVNLCDVDFRMPCAECENSRACQK
jgi:hypothetical protein